MARNYRAAYLARIIEAAGQGYAAADREKAARAARELSIKLFGLT